MKAKIRKTGEIVDVISYGGSSNRRSDALDYVNYIDSKGIEHIESNHLNYYWDFEPIETTTDDIREHAAIAAMQGLLANSTRFGNCVECADAAVAYADALIEKLKKK